MKALREKLGRAPRGELETEARSLALRSGVAAVILSQATQLEGGSRVLTLAVVPASSQTPLQLMGARWPEEPTEAKAVVSSLAWRSTESL